MKTERPSSGTSPPSPRLAPALLRWFRVYRRPLPWRSDRDPYRIWVAEVLLQQTRVASAARYYDRFLARFPSVRHLARARRGSVLKAFEGAGYYARARRLHEAARTLAREHEGELPRSVVALERLPGVGGYTARAIASLAFGVPVVALEANGLRVVARWVREERPIEEPAVRRRLEATLASVLPARDPGRFNEAVMELGETVCLPAAPRCPLCPVAPYCRAARELSDPSSLPRRRSRRPPPRVRAAVAVVREGDRWLVQRRPERGFLGGLWEFPGGRIEPGELPGEAARRELREETGARATTWTSLGVVNHRYSHFAVELHVLRAEGLSHPPRTGPHRRWVTLRALARLPIPRATQKIVQQLRSPPSKPERGLERRPVREERTARRSRTMRRVPPRPRRSPGRAPGS